MKKKTKWVWGWISLSIFLIIVLLFLFRVPLLMQAGTFMAPGGDYSADIAILEGTEFIDSGVVKRGIDLLSSGKVKRIVVVLHSINPRGRPFALNEDYPGLVKKEIEVMGLKERDFKIIVTHIHEPITLIAAKGAMEEISKENITSAILLSPGFHTRRSYLAYQYAGLPFQIKIFPSACFYAYQLDRWWFQEGAGRDFVIEFGKLVYYLARGYIPFRFTY